MHTKQPLSKPEHTGRAYAVLPYVGMVTIWLNDYKWLKVRDRRPVGRLRFRQKKQQMKQVECMANADVERNERTEQMEDCLICAINHLHQISKILSFR